MKPRTMFFIRVTLMLLTYFVVFTLLLECAVSGSSNWYFTMPVYFALAVVATYGHFACEWRKEK